VPSKPFEFGQGPERHSTENSLRGTKPYSPGWKLHIAAEEKNFAAIDQWLWENANARYKMMGGGNAEDSAFTIYVGKKDEALKLADKISSELGNKSVLAPPKRGVSSDLTRGGSDLLANEHVSIRFDPGNLKTDPPEFGQYNRMNYGIHGIPVLNDYGSGDLINRLSRDPALVEEATRNIEGHALRMENYYATNHPEIYGERYIQKQIDLRRSGNWSPEKSGELFRGNSRRIKNPFTNMPPPPTPLTDAEARAKYSASNIGQAAPAPAVHQPPTPESALRSHIEQYAQANAEVVSNINARDRARANGNIEESERLSKLHEGKDILRRTLWRRLQKQYGNSAEWDEIQKSMTYRSQELAGVPHDYERPSLLGKASDTTPASTSPQTTNGPALDDVLPTPTDADAPPPPTTGSGGGTTTRRRRRTTPTTPTAAAAAPDPGAGDGATEPPKEPPPPNSRTIDPMNTPGPMTNRLSSVALNNTGLLIGVGVGGFVAGMLVSSYLNRKKRRLDERE
jgi:hypothetical protein